MFNRYQITKLLIPLILEQILAILVGMADTMMVSSVGESAVSGVALVDSITMVMINLFAALATGGAVVCSQFIGANNREDACKSANQLILVVSVISFILTVISLVFNKQLLSLIFGKIETGIMDNAIIYFYITALSYPFLAVYNGCAAIYRSMGNSKVSMYTSIIMNIINVGGNAICIFGLKMGVAGVAIPTLFSRVVAALIMLYIVRSSENYVYIDSRLRLGYDFKTIKRILRIGVPNGLEGSLFHTAKLLLQSLVSTLGGSSIAAYAVAGNLCSLQSVPGNAIGIGLVTIVGQCVGAREFKQAKKYTRYLLYVNYLLLGIIAVVVLVFLDDFLKLYNLQPASSAITAKLIISQFYFIMFWPLAFTLPSALRAASDVKFTMYVSVISAWTIRIMLSYTLVKAFNWDIMGIWYPMLIDWIVRGVIFTPRFFGGFWEKKFKTVL